MGELPGGGAGEDDELDDDPADDARVGGLGVVSELGFAFLGRVSFSPSLKTQRDIVVGQSNGKVGKEGRKGTHPLEHLLSPDIPQPSIQILDPRRNVLHLALVLALEGARLADGKVEVQPDPAVGGPHVLPR